ncbi:AMP-binding protein [Cytobacillus kochii]|uniref:AMP-binding protein n=1 Tax=Cytobacillus kochii TaxID=859143 RepID=UPI001CD65E69|nr:AMP-binding protein [Cytobacillus kochii]MCA1026657.1 AMP-binding protein [Cytobacillus kochii]
MESEKLFTEMFLKEEVVTKCVDHWAKISPNQIFIYYGESDKSLTYRQFNQLTNSLARSLLQEGIKKGDRISVFLRNPFITTIIMFSIWKCGAVFSPINFNYRGKLLSYQINDTESNIIFTERSLVPLINEISCDIKEKSVIIHDPLEGDHDYLQEVESVPLNVKFNSLSLDKLFLAETSKITIDLDYDDVANIIYTSGTTGPPKGVVQTHRWINGYTLRMRMFMTAEDVVYNDLPLYHVGGAFANIAKAAYVGCTVALWDKFSPTKFWDRIGKCKASMAILLDVMIPWLMKAEETQYDHMNTLTKVHMQPLPQYHHEVAKRFGINFVSAGFGQTEVGNPLAGMISELGEDEGTPKEMYKGMKRDEIIAKCEQFSIPLIDGKEPLNKGFMGKPTFYFDVAVFDEKDRMLPVGKVGQIAFRPKLSYLILQEYFKKPESTLKSFMNLWFHSGDAGYLGTDGYYYFVDRLGGVIRNKGEKISSFQLEDIITSHPEVDLCAAFPVPAEVGDEDDVAVYVVKKALSSITEKEIFTWTKENMPKFMRPKHIKFVLDLPRTPTNKVEKYKLREELISELLHKKEKI